MGKKNKSCLGRALIKDRFGGANKPKKITTETSMLHTTELADTKDWARLNLQSVTEESSFQEFISTATLTGHQFEAEKLHAKFVNPKANVGLLTESQLIKVKEAQKKNIDILRIPRRPAWNPEMTKALLDQTEKDYFLQWRRHLAEFQESNNDLNVPLLVSPYEKNLEFWRQLWRVVERGDVIVQIVDARNPLLFRCCDLEQYVKEVSIEKVNLILVNKADLLNESQREAWAKYFDMQNVKICFYSAIAEEKTEEKFYTDLETLEINSESEIGCEDSIDVENDKKDIQITNSDNDNINVTINVDDNDSGNIENNNDSMISDNINSSSLNSASILSKFQLIELFRQVHTGVKVTPNLTTISLVGYPNVGKSSTINSLFSSKKVSVSATPGKTKHFQTLYLEGVKDLMLCDCPGLVLPSFVSTKAEMVTSGILPVDQMRDHVAPINLICSLIPRHCLEKKYGILLPKRIRGLGAEIEDEEDYDDDDKDNILTAEELLDAYGNIRGFKTANGQPDNPRTARYILKDFIDGKLLYCHAPPNISQKEYHFWPTYEKRVPLESRTLQTSRQARVIQSNYQQFLGSHSRNSKQNVENFNDPQASEIIYPDKEWRKQNKHRNKNKRDKLRRVYAHLDQH